MLKEGQIVAVDLRGHVYNFTKRTTGATRHQIKTRLSGVEPGFLSGINLSGDYFWDSDIGLAPDGFRRGWRVGAHGDALSRSGTTLGLLDVAQFTSLGGNASFYASPGSFRLRRDVILDPDFVSPGDVQVISIGEPGALAPVEDGERHIGRGGPQLRRGVAVAWRQN